MGQPDSKISDLYNPLDYNRYAYVRWNPLKYVDPSGHEPDCWDDGYACIEEREPIYYDDVEEIIEEILEDFEGRCHTDCANFVSTVLHKYGLQIRDSEYPLWKPACDNEYWTNATFLFDLLTEVLGFRYAQLLMDPNGDVNIPEGNPIFYNDGSYTDEINPAIAGFSEEFWFNHVAVVSGQGMASDGDRLPVVLDVDNTNPNVSGKHLYNEVADKTQTIFVIFIFGEMMSLDE